MAFGKKVIQDFDRAYSQRIADMWVPEDFEVRSAPEKMFRTLGATFGGATPSFERTWTPDTEITVRHADGTVERRAMTEKEAAREQRLTDAADLMTRGSGVFFKYVAPAVGVTMAGVGLHDLTQLMNEQTADDQQTRAALMPY